MSDIIPWKKYGIIAELAEKLKDNPIKLGRTALQKIVYLLQEVYGVDCGYEFEFYTYGPFCSEILNDLDTVASIRAVEVSTIKYSSGTQGYNITPSEKSQALRNKSKDFLEANQKNIIRLIDDFGNSKAEDLELYSTIVWVDRDLKSSKLKVDSGIVASLVKELKPKFTEDVILKAIKYMTEKKFVLN